MRAILVGPPSARARLRSELADASIEIVGEFGSLGAARSSRLHADAIVIASDRDLDPSAGLRQDEDPLPERLTPREIEVLELLAEGLSNKGIAEKLGVSDQTVKFHVASISAKLGAANRTDAVRLAVRRGLVTL